MPTIHAPITGIIWQLRVAVGDAVAVEQIVVVIESMKLEIPVESEHAGTVRAVNVSEGDAVSEGDVLVELH